MPTETTPSRVNVFDHAGKAFLLNLDRAERAELYKVLDEAPWEGPTRERGTGKCAIFAAT